MNNKAPKGMSGSTKFFLAVIGLLAIALVAVYLWKEVATRGATARFEAERAEMARQTRGAVLEQTREMLRLSAIPLGWSVRAEMIKENFHQIDDYLRRFVKEPNVSRLALVNYEGTVQVATDKKLEGQTATAVFPQGVLEVNEATVVETDNEVLVAVPILSYDARLGTLVVVYSLDAITQKYPAAEADAKEPATK